MSRRPLLRPRRRPRQPIPPCRSLLPHPRPSEPARRDRLDAEVRLQVDRLSTAAWPVASALDLTARLADGVFAVAPVAFGIGSGRASGRFDLDTNRAPAQAQLRFDLHDMKLESMLANLPPEKRIAGALSGVVDLAARRPHAR